MLDDDGDSREPFRIGLEFGTHYRRDGWGAGLTTLTCMMNLLPRLRAEDRAPAARPNAPDSSRTSTSTVGLPRESRTWRA